MGLNDDNDFGFEEIANQLESKLSGSTDESYANGKLNEMDNESDLSILKKPQTSLVFLYRSDCPFCKQLMPKLDNLAEEYHSKVYFAKINLDENHEAIEDFAVMGVPLVVALKKGHIVGRIEGLREINVYDEWIERIHKGIRPMNVEDGPTSTLD